MALATRTDLKHAQGTANKILEVLVPFAAAVAGFATGDFLGLSAIIGDIVGDVLALIPQLGALEIAPLIAGGLMIGAGLMLTAVKFSNVYVSLIPSALGWFLVGSGARELLNGVSSTVNGIKAASTGQ